MSESISRALFTVTKTHLPYPGNNERVLTQKKRKKNELYSVNMMLKNANVGNI